MKHLVFIVNPKAGPKKVNTVYQSVKKHIDASIYTYEFQETEYIRHGTELAKKAAEKGVYAVVAVGGDGSINDVTKGLLGTNTRLAIIPKGSGNGMARTMGIPLEIEKAINVINGGFSVNMDVAYANGNAFISNAGVAFDALISKKFAKSQNRGFGVYSYLVTKYLWLYKPWDFEISIDGKIFHEKVFMLSVANGQQFGYDFKIAPMADYTDGQLDLVIIKSFPKLLGGIIALRAMNGTIADSPFVSHFKGREITISNPRLKLMQTDGDAYPCNNSITFTIHPGAQQVIVPET